MLVHLFFGCAVWVLVLFLSLWGWATILGLAWEIRNDALSFAATGCTVLTGFMTTAFALFFTGAYLVMPYYEIIITAG